VYQAPKIGMHVASSFLSNYLKTKSISLKFEERALRAMDFYVTLLSLCRLALAELERAGCWHDAPGSNDYVNMLHQCHVAVILQAGNG
jgi:hypothetical protein